MSENFYKNTLYPLQDEVLKIIDQSPSGFYLTGGTAISRCYLDHRYSDDLDFFQNRSSSFHDDASAMIKNLSGNFTTELTISDDSFYRISIIKSDQLSLKVELVNDVGFHKGKLKSFSLFGKVDSWENILSNKISALSRQAGKDIADLLWISYNYSFSWAEIVEDARMKDASLNEITASKAIHDFDRAILRAVNWTDPVNSERDFSNDLEIIARELLHGFDNSLYRKN